MGPAGPAEAVNHSRTDRVEGGGSWIWDTKRDDVVVFVTGHC
jgi:hypothetical protein